MLPALAQLGEIAYFIVLPILLLMGLGVVIQRTLGLDLPTMTRLNFHLVVPAMVYFALVSSTLSPWDSFVAVSFSLLAMVAWAALAYGIAALRGIPMDQRRAMVMTSIFYNSGNYGLPLQELAFRRVDLSEPAAAIQVFVILVQNFTSFTLGVLLAAGGVSKGQWKRNLMHIVKFPSVWALLAALATIAVRETIGDTATGYAGGALRPFWDVVVFAKGGFVAVALVTLGAQLAVVRRGGTYYPVTTSVLLRLIGGPAIGFALIKLMGLEGLIAQVLLISTAMPTSVNCLLLCIQFENHPDFVARSVFYSTLLSPFTVTLTILLAQSSWM